MATAKTDISIRDLVQMVESGELRLPEMQRRYVWRAPRVRDLFDSLYRGYPSGSILVWETDKEQPTRDLSVDQSRSPFSGHKLLLDGQQRLTSLSAVLRGEPVTVKGRRRPIDILFNLEHPDSLLEFTEVDEDSDDGELDDLEGEDLQDLSLPERLRNLTFVVASRALAQQPNWVSVTEVFATDSDQAILKKAGVTSLDDERYDKYAQRLQKLRSVKSYMYPVNVLSRDLSYEEVAEIFVRVNSLGVKLRGSDLALAQITARWPDSLKLFEEFQEECEENYMTLDLGLLVRCLVVFATGQSKFSRVATLSAEKLQEGWEQAKEGIRFSINFFRANADIEDETLLSSPMFFIVIAYYSQFKNENLSPEDVRLLKYWLYVASARGRFSRGSTETLLDADLRVIRNDGGPAALLETLRQQFGRLNFEPSDFAGRNFRSPLFSLVFLALRNQGATDWETGIGISTGLQGRQHKIQFHHIFPKALVKSQYERREVNEIANLAFISGRTNRRIGKKEPSAYLRDIIEKQGAEALKKQGVTDDPALHTVENYREFLKARRATLCQMVNDFLDRTREE
ncbi:MAG: DUF262 domain-containing protein [Bdellovibrionales bacterium]|nr:DUF262 domain-containing protein [Bdellovibrionales bacterium]